MPDDPVHAPRICDRQGVCAVIGFPGVWRERERDDYSIQDDRD